MKRSGGVIFGAFVALLLVVSGCMGDQWNPGPWPERVHVDSDGGASPDALDDCKRLCGGRGYGWDPADITGCRRIDAETIECDVWEPCGG